MTYPDSDIHHNDPDDLVFKPQEAGFYIVELKDRNYIGNSQDPKDYKTGGGPSDLCRGRVVIKVAENMKHCEINGGESKANGWNTEVSQIKTRFWIGPYKYTRPCFVCERPLVPANEQNEEDYQKYVVYPDNGASFNTMGHYGCTTIDDLGHQIFNIIICDTCIVEKRDSILSWDVTTRKSLQTDERMKPLNHKYEWLSEYYEKADKWNRSESDLFHTYGYEWRNFKNGERVESGYDADLNVCGWFKIGDPDPASDDRYNARFKWQDNKKLMNEHEKLRYSIWGKYTPREIVIDEKTGEEHDAQLDMISEAELRQLKMLADEEDKNDSIL